MGPAFPMMGKVVGKTADRLSARCIATPNTRGLRDAPRGREKVSTMAGEEKASTAWWLNGAGVMVDSTGREIDRTDSLSVSKLADLTGELGREVRGLGGITSALSECDEFAGPQEMNVISELCITAAEKAEKAEEIAEFLLKRVGVAVEAAE